MFRNAYVLSYFLYFFFDFQRALGSIEKLFDDLGADAFVGLLTDVGGKGCDLFVEDILLFANEFEDMDDLSSV